MGGASHFLGANSAYGTFEGVKNEWVPDTKSMELTLPDLSRVSRIYADSGEVLGELTTAQFRWWPPQGGPDRDLVAPSSPPRTSSSSTGRSISQAIVSAAIPTT